MDIEKILRAIRKEAIKCNEWYFKCAWREKIENWLTEESKYNKLVLWIKEQIEFETVSLKAFNPANKSKDYMQSYFNNYMEAWRNVSFLIQMKEMLIDIRTTDIERQNIEYTICKVYDIKYNKKLNYYA